MEAYVTYAEPAALAAFAGILPPSAAPVLFSLMAGEPVDPAEVESVLAGCDWRKHREVVGDLITVLLPVEELVPPTYQNWKPVVRDGLAFIGARLSPERLIPKLVEQLTLPRNTGPEARILAFISRIPSLQKIGQTIARNREFSPELRVRLAALEDGIREVDAQEIRGEVERQLGHALIRQQVEIEPDLYAEGSVSALLRFTRRNPPAGEPSVGVFKVLKPFIPQYFHEDLEILSELAAYFDRHQDRYDLGRFNLRNTIEGVKDLFLLETDFARERQSMAAAIERYRDVANVRVPQPIYSLSTPTITAMTEERSVKVTSAFPEDHARCRAVAHALAENLAARPLFSREDLSIFHADPHAGNLRISEASGDIVVLDWALTASLSRDERRQLILLSLAIPLRDEDGIRNAIEALSVLRTAESRTLIRSQIDEFLVALRPGSIPGPVALGDLLARLLRAGVEFSSSFLIYRKMLLTLGDVIDELAPGLSVESVIVEFAMKNGFGDKNQRDRNFCIPLNFPDLLAIRWSMQWFLPRLLAQSLRSAVRREARS
jgi:predicted unusual protein kinase regulating ubiquinone biosynthesis (AarF/ABC1/UbiB family)